MLIWWSIRVIDTFESLSNRKAAERVVFFSSANSRTVDSVDSLRTSLKHTGEAQKRRQDWNLSFGWYWWMNIKHSNWEKPLVRAFSSHSNFTWTLSPAIQGLAWYDVLPFRKEHMNRNTKMYSCYSKWCESVYYWSYKVLTRTKTIVNAHEVVLNELKMIL
jgi:hypothetical protein